MRNTAKRNMCALVLCISLASCQKFLEIPRLNTQVPISTAADCQALLDNIGLFNTGYPLDGEVSAGDYYIRDVDQTFSAGPTNAKTMNQEDRDLYAWLPGAVRPLAVNSWTGPYGKITQANVVMEAVKKIKGGTDATVYNNILGSGLFYRAFGHWQLAQLYCRPYTSAASTDPGIPVRLTSDINEKLDRGTVQDVYSSIIADLNEAVGLLPEVPVAVTRPSRVAAYAMLARVYLSMGDYPKALDNASAALAIKSTLLDFNLASVDKAGNNPFGRFNVEVVFHATTHGVGPTLYPNTATDNMAKIDPSLASSYAANDWRGSLFIKPNSGVHAGSFRFTGNYEPNTGANLFNGLAVDELYLTRAECYARANRPTEAMADLNTLLAARFKTGTFVPMSATSADDALSKVLAERRKELLMRMLRWTDLRRLNQEGRFAVTLSRTVNGVTYTLPPNDPRYVLLIPQEAISNSTMAQNAR